MGRKLYTSTRGQEYLFECPGCGYFHCFTVAWDAEMKADYEARFKRSAPVWTFNGDLERPTFAPSLLYPGDAAGGVIQCHSYVRDGNIQFLDDCGHALRGQTVPLKDIT